MITTTYNPSPLEVQLADIIKELQPDIDKKLKGNQIEEISVTHDKDNPDLVFKLIDEEGDRHQVVLKLIQRADQLLR